MDKKIDGLFIAPLVSLLVSKGTLSKVEGDVIFDYLSLSSVLQSKFSETFTDAEVRYLRVLSEALSDSDYDRVMHLVPPKTMRAYHRRIVSYFSRIIQSLGGGINAPEKTSGS